MATNIDSSPAARGAVDEGLRRRYFTAALDSVVRGGASLLLYGLTPMLLARVLGPHDYGVYATMTALAALVTGLLHLGQNSALHKLLPQHYVNNRVHGGALLADVVLLTLALGLGCYAALYLGADWVAAQLYHDASLASVLRDCAGLILAMAFFNLASSVVAGLQDFQSYNTAMLVRSFVLTLVTSLTVMQWGLWGAFAAQFLALGAGTALLLRSGLKLSRERFAGLVTPDFSWPVLRLLGAFVFPVFLMTLLNSPGYWWANTVLTQSFGFAEAGRFSAVYGLTQLIWLVPVSFYVPAMTYLSEAHAARRMDFGALVGGNLRTIWLMTLPLSLGLALTSPLLLEVLFGSAYQPAVWTTFAMSLTGLVMALIGLLNTALTAAGRIWHGCALTFGWLVIFVVTGGICIPRWGALGCAFTYVISNLCYLIGAGIYLRQALFVHSTGASRLAALTLIGFTAVLALLQLGVGGAFYLLELCCC